ncbi:hypothetical protein NDU88_005190 [Pleurodeles waltl]|uniref:Uncharacterized protein n=1 Tax=Pleurodeles waltl TaxID=8319 RepID=A0AAV7MWQ7_PLEWA|nr:hypothetical protein NDU88_005190 [Pleurodeles waltl]
MGEDDSPLCFPRVHSTNSSILLSLQSFDPDAAQAGSQAAKRGTLMATDKHIEKSQEEEQADVMAHNGTTEECRVGFPVDRKGDSEDFGITAEKRSEEAREPQQAEGCRQNASSHYAPRGACLCPVCTQLFTRAGKQEVEPQRELVGIAKRGEKEIRLP